MQSPSGAECASIVLEGVLADYCNICAAALLVYDMVIAFSREVTHVWGRRLTAATALFMINRYSTLANKLLILLPMSPWYIMTTQSCTIVGRLYAASGVLSIVATAVFFALRVHAISGRDRTLSFFVLTLGIVLPGGYIYEEIKTTYSAPSPLACDRRCQQTVFWSMSTHLLLGTICRCATVAADLVTLCITLDNTLKLRRATPEGGRGRKLVELLIRDGSLYFGVILTLNALDIVLLQASNFGTVGNIINTLSVILVCRLTLNLREFAVEEDPSVPQFSSVKEAPSMTFGSSDTPPDFHDGAEGDYERSNNDQGGQLLRDEIHPLDTENP